MQSFYKQALDRCRQEAIQDESYYNGIAVTVTYNLGRLYEGKRLRPRTPENTHKRIASYIYVVERVVVLLIYMYDVIA